MFETEGRDLLIQRHATTMPQSSYVYSRHKDTYTSPKWTLRPHQRGHLRRLGSNRRFEPGRGSGESSITEAPPGFTCGRLRRSSVVSAMDIWAASRTGVWRLGSNRRFEPGRGSGGSSITEAPPGFTCGRLRRSSVVSAMDIWAASRTGVWRLGSNRRFEPGRGSGGSSITEAPPGFTCGRLRRSSVVSAMDIWAASRTGVWRLGSNRRFEPGRGSGGSSITEAPPGFEPGNKGFAGLCLTAWLRRLKQKGAERPVDGEPLFRERETGLEPATPTLAMWHRGQPAKRGVTKTRILPRF